VWTIEGREGDSITNGGNDEYGFEPRYWWFWDQGRLAQSVVREQAGKSRVRARDGPHASNS